MLFVPTRNNAMILNGGQKNLPTRAWERDMHNARPDPVLCCLALILETGGLLEYF